MIARTGFNSALNKPNFGTLYVYSKNPDTLNQIREDFSFSPDWTYQGRQSVKKGTVDAYSGVSRVVEDNMARTLNANYRGLAEARAK